MIETAPFGSTGHASTRVIFGAAALGAMSQPRADRVLETLLQLFAYVTGPHRFDSVAIYRQADRDAPFEVMSRFSFASEAARA